MAKSVQWWFSKYAESHQNPKNKSIHWICVPVIFWCVLALLSLVDLSPIWPGAPSWLLPYFHLGTVIVLLGLGFYFSLSPPLALGMVLFCALCLWSIHLYEEFMDLPLWITAGSLFVLAWIGQFVGHKIEGKKPSFLTDLVFLLVGPFWLLGHMYRKMGVSF